MLVIVRDYIETFQLNIAITFELSFCNIAPWLHVPIVEGGLQRRETLLENKRTPCCSEARKAKWR
jgi:hypothetical protein